MHSVRVTLVTGKVLTLKVDVPAGTGPRSRSCRRCRPGARRSRTSARSRSRPRSRRPSCRSSRSRRRPSPRCPQLPVPTHRRRRRRRRRRRHRRRRQRPRAGQPGHRRRRTPTPSPTATPERREAVDETNTESIEGKVKKRARKVRERAKEAAATRPRGATSTARRRSTTRPTRSRSRARRRSACRTSSSTSSASRRSCSRSTRPPASSTACAGRSWPRSTRSRPTTGATSTSPRAGALGWMQFMPATWKMYGVDANRDGEKDPFNPVDAIFAAARYLRAAGAETDVKRAIFAYNHADWYVDSVLLRAQVIGGLPSNLVGSLTGLTQGRFPVHAKSTYADDISERDLKRLKGKGNKAVVVESGAQRRGIKVYSRSGAPVIAVNDGRVVDIGTSRRLGRFIKIQDVYGNTYTYGHLKRVAKRYPAPKSQTGLQARDPEGAQRSRSATPRRPAPPPTPRPPPRARRSARPPRRPRRAVRRRSGQAGKATAKAGEAAPVRQPAPPAGRRGRRRRAGVPAHGQDRRHRHLQGLPEPRLRARPHRRRAEAAQEGLARRRRHDPRAPRAHGADLRPAPAVRDPPGRPRRPAHRPEADPRRLEAARVHRDLPRGRQEPVLRLGRGRPVDRPDPADEQGGAGPARPQQPAHRDLRLRPPRRAGRPGRPPRAGHARVPRRVGLQADRHLAARAATAT